MPAATADPLSHYAYYEEARNLAEDLTEAMWEKHGQPVQDAEDDEYIDRMMAVVQALHDAADALDAAVWGDDEDYLCEECAAVQVGAPVPGTRTPSAEVLSVAEALRAR